MATKRAVTTRRRGNKAKERPIPFRPVESEIRRAAERMNGAVGPTVTIDREDLVAVIHDLRDATLGVLDLMIETSHGSENGFVGVLRAIHDANATLVRAEGGAS